VFGSTDWFALFTNRRQRAGLLVDALNRCWSPYFPDARFRPAGGHVLFAVRARAD
jgi:hypothetical protein